jgi:ATP synthase protein I
MMNTLHKKTILGKIITYNSIGIQIGFTIGIGIIGGVYLDRWLNTGPWLTLLGLLIGVVSGFTRLYQIGKEFGNNHHREH